MIARMHLTIFALLIVCGILAGETDHRWVSLGMLIVGLSTSPCLFNPQRMVRLTRIRRRKRR